MDKETYELNLAFIKNHPNHRVIHNDAILWLYKNHPEIYGEFFQLSGSRPTLRAVDPPSALVGGGNSENSAGG